MNTNEPPTTGNGLRALALCALLALTSLAFAPTATAAGVCQPVPFDTDTSFCIAQYKDCALYVGFTPDESWILCAHANSGQAGACIGSVYDRWAYACAGSYHDCTPYLAFRGGARLICG